MSTSYVSARTQTKIHWVRREELFELEAGAHRHFFLRGEAELP